MDLVSAVAEPAFVARRQPDWDRLDAIVRAAQGRGVSALGAEHVVELSPLYREVCADLSRAQGARYSAALVDYLQGLTAAAHTVLYGRPLAPGGRAAGLSRALVAFPRAVRRHRGSVALAFVLFFGPFFAGLAAALAHPDFAARIVPEAMLRPLTEAYRHGFDAGRASSADAVMAGFYVKNNVGIALRCFATGLVLGFGSAFYLVENGLVTGAVVGHVASQGAGANIATFIVGHGSLELGAIVIAGGAGLALGWSIVAPRDATRLASLRAAGRSVVPMVFGAAVMLFFAAAIEGFWSASSAPSSVKRAVGLAVFAAVVSYLAFAGRGPDEERQP